MPKQNASHTKKLSKFISSPTNANQMLISCYLVPHILTETFGSVHFALTTEIIISKQMGRDSVVSIATGYGLSGPGIEFRWEERPPSLL
jgi:hypothetical protein